MQFRLFSILFVALTVLSASCATQNDAPPCQVGQKISCSTTCEPATSLSGTATCLSNGQFSACQPPQETCGNNKDDNCNSQIDENCTNSCTPGQSKQCVTACNTVGTETCVNGQWSACSGQDEVCDGKDNDCDQQIDEGLTQTCNSCGVQGTMQCVNGTWSACSAPTPTLEVCNGKDDDCDQMIDNLSGTAQPLTQQCPGITCQGAVQTCINGIWNQCEGLPSYYEAQETTCDGLDNDCDGLVDSAEPNIPSCACTAGQEEACGSNLGECSMGTRSCVNGTVWTECGGPNFRGPGPEVCDGLDNDCDGNPDNNGQTVDSGVTVCGVTNPALNGIGECSTGVNMCQNSQLQCVGGMEQTPEVCDNKDNDCDGQTDEPPMTGDQWETNDTCATAAWIPDVIENSGSLIINPTNYPTGDVDWFRVTGKELEDFCVFCGDDCEGPYTMTITLKNIPFGADYDLCAYPASENPCGSVPDVGGPAGSCEGLGIFEIGTDPETFSFIWDGTCGGNEDEVFYIKVLSYTTPDSCTPPYTLELSLTAP